MKSKQNPDKNQDRDSNRQKGMWMYMEYNHPKYAHAYGQEARVTIMRNC